MNHSTNGHRRFCAPVALLALIAASGWVYAGPPQVKEAPGRLLFDFGIQTWEAEYVFEDESIPRPYFHSLKTLHGVQVTRNHPPQEGDLSDHATYHPGIWLAFGDISGADFWRNKASVRQERVSTPKVLKDALQFAVENVYVDGDTEICREICTYTLRRTGTGGDWLLTMDTTFTPIEQRITFGDQEEMGFGVRLATPLTVQNGGRILNSEGALNEAGVWGKQADWADYSGVIDGLRAGVTLMAHPENFRKSWFHARDYGLLVANPFGQNAFTEGEASRVVVEPGESLRLRFGAFIHSEAASDEEELKVKIQEAFQHFVAGT